MSAVKEKSLSYFADTNGRVKMKHTKRLKETTKDRHLFWNSFYSSQNFGVWIECTKCKKWRKSFAYSESHEVPDTWHCSMNVTDKGVNGSCDDPEEEKTEQEYIEYAPGSIVWAKLAGYPWWPGMIDEDPDIEEYYWITRKNNFYHVTFLDEQVSRSWIMSTHICPFLKPPRHHKIIPKSLNKKRYTILLNKAEERAQGALKMTLKERLKNFSFPHLYKGRFPRARNLELEAKEIITDALLKEMEDINRLEFLDSDEEIDTDDILEYGAVGFNSDVESSNDVHNSEVHKFFENNETTSTKNCSSSNHVVSAVPFGKIQNKKPDGIKPKTSKQNTSAANLLEIPKKKVKVPKKKHKIENDDTQANQENNFDSNKRNAFQSTDSTVENFSQRKNSISIEDEDTVPLDIATKIIAENNGRKNDIAIEDEDTVPLGNAKNNTNDSHQTSTSSAKNLTFDNIASVSNSNTQDQLEKPEQSKKIMITENVAKISGKTVIKKKKSIKRKLDNTNNAHKTAPSENSNKTSDVTGNDNNGKEIGHVQKKIKTIAKGKSKNHFTKIDVIHDKKTMSILDECPGQIEKIKRPYPSSEENNECLKSSVESNLKEKSTEKPTQKKKTKVAPTAKNTVSDVTKRNLSSNYETRILNSQESSTKKSSVTVKPFKEFKLPIKDINLCKLDEKKAADQLKDVKNSEFFLNGGKGSISNHEYNQKMKYSNYSETKVVPTFSAQKNDKVISSEGNLNSDKLKIPTSIGKSGLKKICNGMTNELRETKIEGSATLPLEDKVASKKKFKQMKPISKKNPVVNGLFKNVSQRQSKQKVTLTNNIQNNYNVSVPEDKSCLNDGIQDVNNKCNEKAGVVVDKNNTETDKNELSPSNENYFTILISDEDE